MFEVIQKEGRARRGRFSCAHGGVVQTPVFMNVGTQAAIKGGVSALDLKEVGCQIELSNTYHLHLRPGDHIVRQMGGLHKFMHWDGPILTDSGGFQVFSLASLRKIKEEGVTFASHIDGHKIFMGPEESMRIQSNLGSDIAMAFDECVENPATYEYAKASCERTARWLERCKAEHDRLNALPDTVNPAADALRHQPGGHLRGPAGVAHAGDRKAGLRRLRHRRPGRGGAGGGDVSRSSTPWSPTCRRTSPGTSWAWAPPATSSRPSAGAWTSSTASCPPATAATASSSPGREPSTSSMRSTPPTTGPSAKAAAARCAGTHSRAYLRHLFKADEVLALRLAVLHNLWFYNELMAKIRTAIGGGDLRRPSGPGTAGNWSSGPEQRKKCLQIRLYLV